MQKNAIIVGMPRSGTSMVTNIFAKAGFFVAENIENEVRAGDEFNPSGYWEAQDLIKANDEIFNMVGYSPDNTWLEEPISSEQAQGICRLSPSDEHRSLVEKYDKKHPWVWKDPRLCYTIGYWWPLLDRNNTRVIFLKRDHEEILNSFLRLNWRTNDPQCRADVLKRIDDHLLTAAESINQHNIPFIEINYSDFRKQPEITSRKISEFFDIKLTVDDLGFNSKLNTSGLRGSLMKVVNKIGDLLPDSLRKFVKKLIPTAILKSIFPHRYTK